MRREVKLSKLLPVLPDVLIDAVCEVVPDPEEAVVIRRGFVRDIESLEEGERAAIQYVSTRDVDRDREILDPRGAMLDQFRLAPQVLWSHDYTAPPIGSDEWIRIDDEGRGIIAKTRYASTDRAKEIFTLKQEGHLRTQSVGFVPVEYVEPNGPGWTETVKRLGKRWTVDSDYFNDVKRIHTKWLMLEHSDVSVPSNVNALQLAISKGLMISPALRKELGIDTRIDFPGEPVLVPDGKPYPNEHACRLKDPGQYERFRRDEREHDGKTYFVIYGIKENAAEEQAYRYPKSTWDADEARSHCDSHDGSFEAAASEEQARRIIHVYTPETKQETRIVREVLRKPMRPVPEPQERRLMRAIGEAIARERGRV